MIICGVKASHDGGVAVIDGSSLAFSVEIEKLSNNRRYSSLGDLAYVDEILRSEGLDPEEVDQFVVDGWWAEGGRDSPSVVTSYGSKPLVLPVAPYFENSTSPDSLQHHAFTRHRFNSRATGYISYHHTTNHAMAAYCTSPFASTNKDALVLVWDGGTTPRMYWVAPSERSVMALGPLLPLTGNTFADFCSHFEPFHDPTYEDPTGVYDEKNMLHHLEIAGKAMAYAAAGTVEPFALGYFDKLVGSFDEVSRSNAFALGRKVLADRQRIFPGLSGADIIATFQEYLGRALVRRLSTFVARRWPGSQVNLVFAGGCALNIKWNSMLRDSGMFDNVWVPPFPNDSGSAIGAACSEMFRVGQSTALTWDVFRGPRLRHGQVPNGWNTISCDEPRLARILHAEGEPVVVLTGRAELGPRALGNRSILAPAVAAGMKDRLNEIKQRALYRPVAPICLSSRAGELFRPGNVDRYMLFEHLVRSDWRDRLPAVTHLDGTARLQTIDEADGPVSRIVAEYHSITGIPVLCNTSANLKGCGFFPDVASAAIWGGTRYIWSEGRLYRKK